MSLFRSARSTRPAKAVTGTRTRRALARALASAPTPEARHELLALSTRL